MEKFIVTLISFALGVHILILSIMCYLESAYCASAILFCAAFLMCFYMIESLKKETN